MRPDRLTKIVSCNLAGLACAEGERDVGRRIMRLPRVSQVTYFIWSYQQQCRVLRSARLELHRFYLG